MVPKPDHQNFFDHLLNETDDLVFLRDEGLDLLALFKKIKDPTKRNLLVQLIRSLGEDQPGTAPR